MKKFWLLLCLLAISQATDAAQSEKPIGVFDSGTGGLTVMEAMLTLDSFDNKTGLPGRDGNPDFAGEAFQYLADQANMPYGNYAAVNKIDLLREHIHKNMSFLLHNKPPVKMIVIACNTATAYGWDDVKDIGVPVVGVINAGARAAMEYQKAHPGTIGILATAGTVASRGYPNTIKKLAPNASVVSQGCVGLAECIDRDWSYFSDTATAVRSEYKGPSLTSKQLPISPSLLPVYNFNKDTNRLLCEFDASGNCVEMQLNDSANYVRYHLVTMLETMKRERHAAPLNTLILGCTHYPYLRDTIAAVLKELYEHRYRDVLAPYVELIDPAVETAKEAYREMRKRNLQHTSGTTAIDEFFISVPNTSLKEIQLQPDGWFTYDYKYGRKAGTNKEYVKYVPFDTKNISRETYQRLAVALPNLSRRLNVNVKPTSITQGSRTLPVSPIGPCNPWPRFRFQIRDAPVKAADNLSVEDRAGMFTNAVVPPMPYLIQDNYSRERKRSQLPTITVENQSLRALFYPSLGGRMISLYDKRNRRELLFDNPVLQPANLAIRNAWFSGGVEWNGPLYGHSLLTCSPVFAGVVETSRGQLLRLYEFDRALETTWQVDILLPPDDDRLWIHVKAINPNAHDINFYWWTNIAVPLARDTRVFAPSEYALSHDAGGNSRIPFPNFAGFDGSYPHNYPHAKSVFFRKPGAQKLWSVCVDSRGRGLSHISTQTLSGRKLFTWGTSRGGKRWMDFLSAPGKGDYIEIQGGVTPTQLQTRPLKAGASIEWTECLSAFAMDAKAVRDSDYVAACAAAGKIVDERVSNVALQEMDAFLRAQANLPVKTVLHRGAAWGCLHEKRTGKKLSHGLAFECEPGEEERPWAELLATGKCFTESVRSFNVSPGWIAVLTDSARRHGWTWLHHLHLGVAQLEAGAFADAKKHFEASLALKDTAAAHRNLALLHERDGDLDMARKDYERAWSLCGNDTNLAVEFGDFLVRRKRQTGFAAFVKSLPATIAHHERIQLQSAQVALEQGDYAAVRRLLQREFCTIREGELSLSDLWFASYIKETEQRKGRELTANEKQQLMRKFPPPREIDFRMK
jgi:glutamate racemase